MGDVHRVRTAPGTQLSEMLGDLKAAGERGRALTTGLLAYVGRVPATTDPVDLRSVVRDNDRLLRSLVGTHVALEVVPEATPVMVRGDAGQLAQVLLNLVTNGAEAIEGDGAVSVQTLVAPVTAGEGAWSPAAPSSGACAILRVSDTGSGIAPCVRRRIFDPFVSTKKPGRGLGLAVLIGIVRSHGGAVRAEPTPSGGTCFEVAFPWAAGTVAEAQGPVAALREPASAKGASVLMVDDDATLRKLGKFILEDVGLEVVVAEDGPRALSTL